MGESEFWVSSESPEHLNYSPASLGGGAVRMVLVLSDPDAAFARAIQSAATVVGKLPIDLMVGEWGEWFDPLGHHWEIGKPR